jgi:hypothetical protein
MHGALTEDGDVDEETALRCQQILMAPKRRLAAELEWLLGLAPVRARQLIEASSVHPEVLADLPRLAAANLAADRCGINLDHSLRDAVLDFQAEQSHAEIIGLLNEERTASGFPQVAPELLAEAMPQLMADHAEALLASIQLAADPGVDLIGVLAERFGGANPSLVEFLDDIVERFDTANLARLQRAESEIDTLLGRLRHDPWRAESYLGDLRAAASSWATLRRPRQFALARRHLPDTRTQELYDRARTLLIHYANELDRPDYSLAILEELASAFERAPTQNELLAADLITLRDRIKSSSFEKVVASLQKILEACGEDHSSLCKSAMRGDFTDGGAGLSGQLYREFKTAALALSGTEAAMVPFQMIFSLAIDIHNKSAASEESDVLLRGLELSRIYMTPEMTAKIQTNRRIVQNVLLQRTLERSIKRKDIRDSIRIAGELSSLSDSDEDRAGWTNLKNQLEIKRREQRARWAVWVTFIVIPIGISMLSSSNGPSTGR